MFDNCEKSDQILTLIHRHRNWINETLYRERNNQMIPVILFLTGQEGQESQKNKKKSKINATESSSNRDKGKIFYISREDYERDQRWDSYKELTLA